MCPTQKNCQEGFSKSCFPDPSGERGILQVGVVRTASETFHELPQRFLIYKYLRSP